MPNLRQIAGRASSEMTTEWQGTKITQTGDWLLVAAADTITIVMVSRIKDYSSQLPDLMAQLSLLRPGISILYVDNVEHHDPIEGIRFEYIEYNEAQIIGKFLKSKWGKISIIVGVMSAIAGIVMKFINF